MEAPMTPVPSHPMRVAFETWIIFWYTEPSPARINSLPGWVHCAVQKMGDEEYDGGDGGGGFDEGEPFDEEPMEEQPEEVCSLIDMRSCEQLPFLLIASAITGKPVPC